MKDPLELEIHLDQFQFPKCHVTLRLRDPDAQQDRAPRRANVEINFEKLTQYNLNQEEYGRSLFQNIFADPNLLALYDETRGLQGLPNQGPRPLRIRIYFYEESLKLNNLRWETLRDHRNNEWLLDQDDVRFSRFLSSDRWEPIEIRSRDELRALVIIANPNGLGSEEWINYDEIEVKSELNRAEISLGPLFDSEDVIASDRLSGEKVSLTRIRQKIREGAELHKRRIPYDVIYLVCHGSMTTRGQNPGPILLLEDSEGNPAVIRGIEIANEILSLSAHKRPRLIVLVSCESVDSGLSALNNKNIADEKLTADTKGAFLALGPMLSKAGVPAVIAMQGSITVSTINSFIPELFHELLRDYDENGVIDKAVAVARSSVRHRNDAWMPVLFLRLRDGRLWPSESRQTEQFEVIRGIDLSKSPLFHKGLELIRLTREEKFINKESSLNTLLEVINNKHFLVITGLPGVGKTILSSMLISRLTNEENVFWYSFQTERGIEELLWELTAFMVWKGNKDLISLLKMWNETEKSLPIEVLSRHLLEHLCNQGKYYLYLEDLHTVEENQDSINFVREAIHYAKENRLDLVITSRTYPQFVPTGNVYLLEGLTKEETQNLFKYKGFSLPTEIVQQLQNITNGNAHLLNLAGNILSGTENMFQLLSSLDQAPDIERYLNTEVNESLGETERKIMKTVSIFGEDYCSRDAVEAVIDEGEIKQKLRNLVERNLILEFSGPTGIEFSQHSLLQSFFYDLLSRRERQEMHLRAGKFYENDENDIFKAAWHFEKAQDYDRSAQLGTQDIWGILNLGLANRLMKLLSRLSAQSLDDILFARVNLALGSVCTFLSIEESGLIAYHTALSELEKLDNSSEANKMRAQVCKGIAELYEYNKPKEALEWIERGLIDVKGTNTIEEADLYIKSGSLHIALWDLDQARTELQKGLDIMPQGAERLRAGALMNLSTISGMLGELDEAEGFALQAKNTYALLGDNFRLADVHTSLGLIRDISLDWTGAIEEYEKALELAKPLGNPSQLARLSINLGILYMNLGEDNISKENLTYAFNTSQSASLDELTIATLESLAQLHIRQKMTEVAKPYLMRAEKMALEMDSSDQLIEIFRDWAELLIIEANPQLAMEYIQKSLDLATDNEMLNEMGICLRVLGEIRLMDSNIQQAFQAFEKSESLLLDEDPFEAARTSLIWGGALFDIGQTKDGKNKIENALSVFSRISAGREINLINSRFQ